MLELGKAQRFRGGSDAIIVPVEIIADRVNRAPDVHVRHGGHHDAKRNCFGHLPRVDALTFADLVLIPAFTRFFSTRQISSASPACGTRRQRRFTTKTRRESTQGNSASAKCNGAMPRRGSFRCTSRPAPYRCLRDSTADLQLEMKLLR